MWRGKANADTLVSIENVVGGAGNDEITGDSNNNALDGGSGYDTAIFYGARADYTITWLADGDFQVADSVAGRDGTDLLKNIEKIRFSDGELATADIPRTIYGTAGADTLQGEMVAIR